jgi:hypothetical protein
MKWILIIMLMLSALTAQAESSIYSTKDDGDAPCVPVHVTPDPSVQYNVTTEQWNTPSDVMMNAQHNEQIGMNFRIPPSRINNKAFQRHIGASEVFVGGYASNGSDTTLDVLGNPITTQPAQECP